MRNTKKVTISLTHEQQEKACSLSKDLFTSGFSYNTDKLIFIYEAMNNRKEISTHIFNEVFCEFEDTFYKGKKYKNAIANFKKYIKIAAENKGHKIVVLEASNNGIVHGVKNLWSVEYCN
jgi:uncharacterized protein YoaH (UPF0181 family)